MRHPTDQLVMFVERTSLLQGSNPSQTIHCLPPSKYMSRERKQIFFYREFSLPSCYSFPFSPHTLACFVYLHFFGIKFTDKFFKLF